MWMLPINFTKSLIILLLICHWRVATSKVGECDTCLTTNSVACLDENHFVVCHDGKPSTTIVTCPDNMVCTADRQICRLTRDDFTPICYYENCGQCQIESNNVFTCLDRISYAYCVSSGTIDPGSVRSCPKGFVCNIYAPGICASADTHEPSCLLEPMEPLPTPTPIPTPTPTQTPKPTPNPMVGECDTCLITNNAACLDENHFVVCHDGEPSTTIVTCPDHMVCTADRQICRLTTEGFTPICYSENCGQCQIGSNNVFTCLDRISYAYCDSSGTIDSESIRSCPEGFICNTYAPGICASADTHKPSCLLEPMDPSPTPTPTTPTPTPPTARDPNTICRDIRQNGYFKSDDPTCQEYIYCYLLSGEYLGWPYYCDGFFNAETGKCQKERPAGCL